MERQQLRELLQELHTQLQTGAPVDPETATLLKTLAQDVDRAAATPSTAAAPIPAVDHQSLLDRMLSVTEDFEESHPQLAEIIGRMATTLSRIGI